MPISCCALSMAVVASPSDAPGARLKEMVTTGNCPWWLTDRGLLFISNRVKALRGTAAPFTVVTALGLAEPEPVVVLGVAEGLGEAAEAELPEDVVAVTVWLVEEPVVSAEEARAERT